MSKASILYAVGGLSNPSKMPGHGYSLPCDSCKVGSKLRTMPGSVCHGCYANRGNYIFPNVQGALFDRLYLVATSETWVEDMVEAIETTGDTYFRWHDSGDLQDEEHLAKICRVCELTPHVKHWLPTKEHYIVRTYLNRGRTLPANLCVRLSTWFVSSPAISLGGLNTSTVSCETPGYRCPASHQHTGTCGECRACWNTEIPNVDYLKH